MTCIVGYVENSKVYIGGDSAGVDPYRFHIQSRNDEKVFTNGEMIFGFTTSFRMGQLLRYKFVLPDHDPRHEDLKYLCSDFMDAVLKCFKDNEYAIVKEGVAQGGTFLIGYRGHLYQIQDDFQVSSIKTPFDAVGCGDAFALGAMRILCENPKMSPEEKVTKALQVAEEMSAGVAGPFNVVSI